MATASVTNANFVQGATPVSSQVDANYADLVAFMNGSVLHVDGSKAMTARLSLAALNPTTDNHAVRKAYLDGPYVHTYDASGVGVNLTWDLHTMSTEIIDTHGANTSGIFTAPIAGVYYVSYMLTGQSGVSRLTHMRIKTSTRTYQGPQIVPLYMNAMEAPCNVMSVAVVLAAGEYARPEFEVIAGTGGLAAGSWMTVAWLHG